MIRLDYADSQRGIKSGIRPIQKGGSAVEESTLHLRELLMLWKQNEVRTTIVKIHVPVLGQNFPKPTKVRPGTNYVILQAAY